MNRDDDLTKEVITGNGIDRDLAATTNHMLRKSIVETRDLKEITSDLIKSQEKQKEQ